MAADEKSADWWAGANAVVEAVESTSHEESDGDDLEEDIGRLVELMHAVKRKEDPETWSRFAAPVPERWNREDNEDDE